jgi:N-glycosylase/DNA lyase
LKISVNIAAGKLLVNTDSQKLSAKSENEILKSVKHIFRLDEELGEFYRLVKTIDEFSWIAKTGAGRMLRSATVFEDLVKTMCTTNCSWALTDKMVSRLVSKLGEAGANGSKAFPCAYAMAEKPEKFYREEIRAGYRSQYFVELARRVSKGDLQPENWLNSDLSTEELKKELKSVKGVGNYAAENLLKLLGRYEGLALDSWLRSQFYKIHNRGKRCSDRRIEKFYRRFNEWNGLAFWCDMTKSWLDAS